MNVSPPGMLWGASKFRSREMKKTQATAAAREGVMRAQGSGEGKLG